MKVYKVEILILDFDEIGESGIQVNLENTSFPNHCIAPKVFRITEKDIGEWSDDHKLNDRKTWKEAFKELFGL